MLGNVCDCDFNMKFFNFYFVCIYCFLIISLAHGAVLYNSSEIKRIEDIPMRRGKAGSFNKFTKEQLLNTKFPHKISNDIDLDPCKSGTFYDDVAMPNSLYEMELEMNRNLGNVTKQYNFSIQSTSLKPKIKKTYISSERKLISQYGKINAIVKSSVVDATKRSNDDVTSSGYIVIREELPLTLRSIKPEVVGFNSDGTTDLDVIVESQRSYNRWKRAATARRERIWDYGIIPYEIDTHFSGMHRSLFKQAMRHWENYTCVKFVERSATEHNNYIIFTERPCGCCSFVGKRGNGAQAISIGKNCDKFGIVVHELGHVVGFWHEHTRPDRDNHVQIVRDHIMTGQEYNFNKLTEEEVNSLGLPYDYDSIMHYARNTFSKGTYLDTIYPIETDTEGKKTAEIGQRIRLSEGDISQTKMLYKCPKCGQTLQKPSGNFSHYQININGSIRCEWRITASHGEHIQVNITDLDINKSDQCSTDYLEIRDGYFHKSKLIGRYCGKGWIQELITTTANRMLVVYVMSDKNYKQRGFAANYEAICGGEINVVHLEVGHFESPNYPDDYESNKECAWVFTAPESYQVALKFQTFEIENHDNCAYDYIEIHSGDSADSPLIGIYCGYKLPPDIRSSSNKLYVKFVSDSTVQKLGFSALYMTEFDECSSIDHGCEQMCINNLGGYECACKVGYQLHSDNKHCEDICGGRIDEPNGTITSPSFPDLYPGNKSCVWEIFAPLQQHITLNFTHFDLEGNNTECEYDRVEVYSKMSPTHLRRHGVFCGNYLPPVITSDKNILRIEFESDNTIHKSGFAAIFLTG